MSLRALRSLATREVVRFVRQPSRVVAGVGTPLLLWGFLASGLAETLRGPTGGVSSALFLLPGTVTLVVVFSSIFAAMSLIEDRREGFLQSVLVSPTPWWCAIGAKALGGGAVALAQAGMVLLAAPLVGEVRISGLLLAGVAVTLTSIAVTSLGLAAAWWVNSSEGFHGVMNLVLLPMWLFSGALFPADGATGWMRIAMWCDPLRWPTEAMRAALGAGPTEGVAWAWVGTVAFPLATIALAGLAMRGRGAR